MGTRDLLFVGLIVGGAAALAGSLYPHRVARSVTTKAPAWKAPGDVSAVVAKVDAAFRGRWQSEGVSPVGRATEAEVVRRLSLALTGTIPSLQELRGIEALPEGRRADAWAETLLNDRRTDDYLAERFARAYVGVEGGPFLVFRRRRFVTWLSDQFNARRPYDAVVRDLIASDGLWTDRPATNFVTVTYDPDKKAVDAERLAGRVSRAFLGVRIDCARCHDHPFADWTQKDFQGIAAFFGKAESGLTGIHEGKSEFRPTDRKSGKEYTVMPRVPFRPELLPVTGNRRERLARWVTDRANPALPRATVNRVWALMFGKGMVEPVDNLPEEDELPSALITLADDFAAHGYDLRRLIRVVASTEVFRLQSAGDPEPTPEAEKAWAVFPLTPLRAEQVVGALTQSASLTTIDGDSPIVVRLIKGIGESGFIKRYGDVGEEELDPHAGTIPQRLLLMNGDMVRDKVKADLFTASFRVASFAPDDESAVAVAFQTVLSRRPSAGESAHFAKALAGTTGTARKERVSDLFWSLVNATEFSWNH